MRRAESLVQRSPSECGVSECDLETTTMMRPRPTGAVEPSKKSIVKRRIYRPDFNRHVYLPIGPGNGYLNSSTSFIQNVNILRTKKGNVMKYTTFCRGIN